MKPSLSQTTVRGSAYSVSASAVTIGLGALRTYLMVIWLLPDEIGLAALAIFYVELVKQFGSIGLNYAYIHLPETDEDARHTFISFNFLIGGLSLLLIAVLAPAIARFYPSYDHLAVLIWAFAAVSIIQVFNQSQGTLFEKDLAFKDLALADVIGAFAKTIAGPGMAYLGFGAWSLLWEFAAGAAARFAVLHWGKRRFKVRLGWKPNAAAMLWAYGKSIWMSTNLSFLIDNFDDFWVGTALGRAPLGLYNKAYEFSRYPRRVVANPILAVFYPTFAHLQNDRLRLSQAFFRSTSLIVRSSGLFSLVFVLIAPEAFHLFLPAAWQPMLLTFQLMLVYTFLDPLSLAAQRLLLAAGRTAEITRIRWIQLLIFIPAVALGAALSGIEGVALAADLMVLAGTVLFFRGTLHIVDYSSRRLWLWPVLGLAAVTAGTVLLEQWIDSLADPVALIVKLAAIPIVYCAILWLAEKEQLSSGIRTIAGLLRKPAVADAAAPTAGAGTREP